MADLELPQVPGAGAGEGRITRVVGSGVPEAEAGGSDARTGRGRLSREERIHYANSVWVAVLRKTGRNEVTCMAPAEWQVLSRWMEIPIPLRVVLRGIKDCGGNPGPPRGVRAGVEQAYVQWRKALA